jgi:IS605 OrfB family transposase
MRLAAHGVVWFSDPADQQRVETLIVDYCSARRAAYQAIQRGLVGNEVRKAVKKNYAYLGARYVSDAVSEASKISQPGALFGGKKAWRDLQANKLSKEAWQKRRNDTLYSRGDRAKQGNPNLRVVGDELWVNDPAVRGKWIIGRLWLNRSADLSCYEVRVQRKDGKFKVTITWEVEDTAITTTSDYGVLGIDTNPDGLALVETNDDGCLLQHCFISSGRAMFARSGKRSYDVRQMAAEVVEEALQVGKHIVLERLNFKNKKSPYRKFNRMRHNFLYRQMLEAIKARAAKMGVGIIEVHPAFTSMIGLLKYADHYSLNRHTAAALVIARKGMGIKEKVRVNTRVTRVKRKKKEKQQVNLEGRSCCIALSETSFSWMQHFYDVHPKLSGLTAPHLDADNTIRHRVQVQGKTCKIVGSITGQTSHKELSLCRR